jgi:hypothetical protein
MLPAIFYLRQKAEFLITDSNARGFSKQFAMISAL